MSGRALVQIGLATTVGVPRRIEVENSS